MKRKIDFLIVALFAVVLFASCERVAPNYAGVLMENYGKQGKILKSLPVRYLHGN